MSNVRRFERKERVKANEPIRKKRATRPRWCINDDERRSRRWMMIHLPIYSFGRLIQIQVRHHNIGKCCKAFYHDPSGFTFLFAKLNWTSTNQWYQSAIRWHIRMISIETEMLDIVCVFVCVCVSVPHKVCSIMIVEDKLFFYFWFLFSFACFDNQFNLTFAYMERYDSIRNSTMNLNARLPLFNNFYI